MYLKLEPLKIIPNYAETNTFNNNEFLYIIIIIFYLNVQFWKDSTKWNYRLLCMYLNNHNSQYYHTEEIKPAESRILTSSDASNG